MSTDDRKVPPLVQRREAFARRKAAAPKPVYDGERFLGTGEPNRHGMPKYPPGQRDVPNWPVLDLGDHPAIARADWRLTVEGLVARPAELDFAALMALPQTREASDFHCVTTWSRNDLLFTGVRFCDLMAHVGVLPEARFVFVTAYDRDAGSGERYSTNLPLADAMTSDVLLVHSWDDAPLPRDHGGPVRMVTPRLYAWKGAKWIRSIRLLPQDVRGFWEKRGYSNTANPWREERYGTR
jgi:DMSO/TMAO reductase YedYZ molybdopterin-dependent catalytic subunit